jgi:hypothetical protein
MIEVVVTPEAKDHLLGKGTTAVRIEHAQCGG